MSNTSLDELIEGERLKHTYQVVRQISKNERARTCLVIDQTNNEEFAVRFIKSDLIDKMLFHEQLQKKLDWLTNLKGQHIVSLVDIGVSEANDQEYSFIIMEPLRGKRLQELIAKPKPFAVQRALNLVRQVAMGLDEARQQGVQAHRDLNPTQIYVDAEGTAKIADFSVALHSSEDTTANLHDSIGTPAYMSPEQIDDPLEVDIRTDLYALGVIAFEMLLGRRPFEGTVREIFTQHLQEEAPAIQRPDLSEAERAQIQAIINRCLAKNRVERFQSPGELVQAIDAFLQGGAADSAALASEPESSGQDITPSQTPTPALPSSSTQAAASPRVAELEARLKRMEARLQQLTQAASNQPQQTAVPQPATGGAGGILQRLTLFSWALLIGAIVLLCMAGITLVQIGGSDDVLEPIVTGQANAEIAQMALAETVAALAEQPTITPIPTETPTIPPTATVLPSPTPTPPPPTEMPIPPPSLPPDQVSELLFTNETLWVVFSGHLAAFDGENWQTFTSADGLPGGDLTDVLIDNQGIIWVGATTGLANREASEWTILTVGSELIPSNTITAVAFDGTYRWFGTDNGLARFDGTTWDLIEPPILLAYEITTLTADTGLWVGTSAGLNRFDSGVWSALTIDDGAIGNEITAIAPDSSGRLWVSTTQGLSLFDSGSWQTVRGVDVLENNPVHDIAIGPDGVMWLGTQNGAVRYDGVNWALFTTEDGLVSNQVTAVTTDPSGIVWIGTTGGLMRYDGTMWQLVTVPGS